MAAAKVGGGERGCRLWRDANRLPVDDGGSTSFKVLGKGDGGGGGGDETLLVLCAASATVLGALICSLRMAHRYQGVGWVGGSNFCLFAFCCLAFVFSSVILSDLFLNVSLCHELCSHLHSADPILWLL